MAELVLLRLQMAVLVLSPAAEVVVLTLEGRLVLEEMERLLSNGDLLQVFMKFTSYGGNAILINCIPF